MQSLKILVVEDETITAMDIRDILEEAGHVVTDTVQDFEAALDSAKSNLPDMAIVDIRLEGSAADGIITAKALMELHAMPIIYLTATPEASHPDSKIFRRAKETQPAAYLLKPFRPNELVMQVEVAWHNFKSNQQAYTSGDLFFTVKNKGYHRISPHEVLYIEADGSSAKIYLVQEKTPYEVSMNLNRVADNFTAANFFHLSRSFLINLDFLERIEGDKLYLKHNERPLQVPASTKQELIRQLTIIKTK
ncbi:response regulator [Runella sp.]|uniref:response regulator n=1 Tax=Runella sp. TaxID=1960881 RepID=UPI003D12D879